MDGANSSENPPHSTLFPIFPVSDNPNPSQDPQWLCNPSFTFDPSSLPPPSAAPAAAAAAALHQSDSDSDSDGPHAAPAHPKPPSYSPVASPSSSDEERRSKRRERRRKKRKRDRDREEPHHGGGRKSGVRAWAGSDAMPAKDYYFDSHGDRDNLEFGSLYRMDVARYRPYSYMELAAYSYQVMSLWRRYSSIDAEDDLDFLDTKLKSGGRYFSMKYTALERHKDFKHVKIVDKSPSLISEEYIPLAELRPSPQNDDPASRSNGELEESWEDELIRRTRELNKMSRDSPHDEKVWLAFAEFQDKIASSQPQKAARLQTLEKKISILEKAVELNPENEDLILCLLKSYQGRDTSDVLIERWEKVLMQHFDSVKLWKEFLLVLQGDFSRFKVSEMRKSYANAIQALSSACNKLRRQGNQSSRFQSIDPSLIKLELGLVDTFISMCRLEWQTGHHELATGLFQAELEYSLFCPSLLLSSQSKQRLFEHFWNSGGARIGEDEALGWSSWLEKEEQNRHNINTEEISQEIEGGWTGWSDPPSKRCGEEPEKLVEHDVDENNGENLENEGTQMNDDVESLLRKLGINVVAEPHSEVKDAKTWYRWSQEESVRDCEQWMPVREHSGIHGEMPSPHADDNLDREGNEQLLSVILFEDINEYLFSLCSEEARFSLVSQFIDFYGGKISRWTCTNDSSWTENTLSLDTLPDSLVGNLRKVFELVNRPPRHLQLESLFGRTHNISAKINMMKFLRNSILLFLNVFPRNCILMEAIFAAEELFATRMHSSDCAGSNPSRSLAKFLLKKDRQDLLLCGVYARTEATCGNIDNARNTFDMSLLSANELPMDLQENVPLLYFWYAEMEMTAFTSGITSEPSKQRAIHMLSCLGSNEKYTPFKSQISSLQLLRARQGFKEQIKGLRSTWAHGGIKECSIAIICSASMFEFLTCGSSAGVKVIEEAFSMVLPDRKRRSLQLESLWIHYIGVLQRHLKQLKFSRVWEAIKHGMQIYPCNPEAFTSMVEVGYLFTVPYNIRHLFDECSQRNPSVVVYLFALSFEFGKAGSRHRIRGLFEKALASDKLEKSVLLWRCYLAYELDIECNSYAARRIFFRAVHACPWSKTLWLDGFQKLGSILTAKELSDLQEVMRDKELHMRTDIYEILLQDENET